MSGRDRRLDAYAEATEPGADAVGRARQRLRLGLDEAAAAALLRALPPPSDRALQRLRARVRASLDAGAPRRWRLLVPAALAAAAVLALSLPTPPPPEPRTVQAALESAEATRTELVPGVQATSSGWGYLAGTDRAPAITWGAGTLRLEVDPAAGLDVRIETPSGVVRVLGTILTVEVADVGTTVRVERGRVEVACALGSPRILTAGGSASCARASSANLLSLAIAARTHGAPDGRVLALAEEGLRAEEEEGAVRDELRLLRLQSLLALGRRGDALAAADAYVAGPRVARRAEVLRTAAKLALGEGGCARSVPYLRALRETGRAAAEDLVPLARCVAAEDPAEARAVLDEAAATADVELRGRIDALRASLPE